jgi:hypothetical protein
MKLKLIVLLCLKTLIYSDLLSCGNNKCSKYNSVCLLVEDSFSCVCNEGFTTYPETNNEKCNYSKKSQLTAFLLELFITYGAGHIYSENYKYGIPKLFFWLFSYYLFIALRMIVKNSEENPSLSLIVVIAAFFFCFGMLTWHIVDLVLYGMNIYSDGNGIDLIPW